MENGGERREECLAALGGRGVGVDRGTAGTGKGGALQGVVCFWGGDVSSRSGDDHHHAVPVRRRFLTLLLSKKTLLDLVFSPRRRLLTFYSLSMFVLHFEVLGRRVEVETQKRNDF